MKSKCFWPKPALVVSLILIYMPLIGYAANSQVSAGADNTVALKPDGTVVATGYNAFGQCNVSSWSDIQQISSGGQHTVGLESYGTVVAVGDNFFGECNINTWNNMLSVDAGGNHTAGLRSGGTVVAVGDNSSGQCNVSSWSNIKQISAGGFHTVGLRFDGTLVAVGDNSSGQCNVSSWSNIKQVSAGDYHTIGLKNDGTVVSTGNNFQNQCDVFSWKDIEQISAGGAHTVGLKSDGTVVAVGNNSLNQCNVDAWNNIIQVSAGYLHTAALKSDGSVIAVGWDEYGQCAVDDWNLSSEGALSYTVIIKWWDDTSDGIVDNGIGQYKPLRNAKVLLYDQDLDGDDWIADGILDHNGSYTFKIFKSYDMFDGPDLYVRIILECPSVKFTLDSGFADPRTQVDNNVTESITSTSYLDKNEQSTYAYVFNEIQNLNVSFQNETNTEPIPQVVVRIKPEWFKDKPGYEMEPFLWLDYNILNLGYDSIHLSSSAWNKFIIAHEYSHHIMYKKYNNSWPAEAKDVNICKFLFFDCTHAAFSETTLSFAFVEGLAEFMQCWFSKNDALTYKSKSAGEPPNSMVFSNTGVYNHEFSNIEDNHWWQGEDYNPNSTPKNPNGNSGKIVEGAIASIFWDIFDEHQDDDESNGNIENGFKKIWRIIGEYRPNDIIDFYQKFISEYPEDRIKLITIYRSHGIQLLGAMPALPLLLSE